MKNILYILISITLFTIVGCDEVEPFEDGTYKKEIEVIQGNTIPQIVLFEFTGWNCLNCPDGHEMIHGLKETYGESVKALGIHAGSLTEPGPTNEFDFTNETSDALFERFDRIDSKPNGAVNSMNSADLSTSVNVWENSVNNIYQLLADTINDNAEVYLTYDISISDTEINASITGSFNNNKDLPGKYNLSVYVVQNEIIDMQNEYGVPNPEYEHNHVLRASMKKGIIGEELTVGTDFAKSYTLKIDELWADAGDVFEVVAFVYDTETNRVLLTKIIKPKTEDDE